MDRQPKAIAAQHVVFRRGLGLVLATLVLPGSAQLQSGNKTVGRVALRTWMVIVGLVLLTGILALVSRGAVVTVLASGVFYRLLQPVLIALGLGWALLIADAWRLAQPLNMDRSRRLGFGLVSLLLAFTVAASGFGLGSAAHAQGDLISKVVGGGGDSRPNAGRYNVLMLGADAGAGRVGLRPDTIMVASVHEQTGRTVIFSLPRNLEGARFPDGSPLKQLYPDGYECEDHSCMLNAIYGLGHEHADLYPGVDDPGLQAMREVVSELLGLPINYTVMVDLMGFTSVIDAVGGIRLDIGKRVPIGGGTSPITGWIEAGRNQHLDGYRALWFARSRQGSTDYERMLRQKCVVNAMMQQLDPLTVVTKFNQIAGAGSEVAYTDVPAREVNKLATLATKTRRLPIKSVSFTPPLLFPGNPKLDVVRDTVATSIRQSEALDGTAPAGKRSTAPATTAPADHATQPSAPLSTSPRTTPARVSGGGSPTAPDTNDGTPAPTNEDLGAVCS
ncbi:LCP family protein [Tessaracoccus sp. SD287]|uniref:LCP family protein n=1 Tax=Tessaracoccus sp. SD287 TaxID=2782008 RepID=UPI001A95D96F|nr:LCP family protein [Tessaracoccus sp. SD287]